MQRADLWGLVLALQDMEVVHVGVDNLNVVRHVGRICDDIVILYALCVDE